MGSTPRLGPHVIRPTAAALRWARVAPIVKALNDPAPLLAARPDAWRVWRQSCANEADTSDPIGSADRGIASLKGYRHPRLVIQVWCGAHPTREQLKAAVDRCHALGYLTCGSSHFTGDYTAQDWDDEEAAGVDVHGPQCYWGNQGFTLDHALRYRLFWKLGHKPVMILECGRDEVEGGKAGWTANGLSAEQYVGELRDYAAETERDRYVLGVTPFTSGATLDWEQFDLDSISDRLHDGGNVGFTLDDAAAIADPSPNYGYGPKRDRLGHLPVAIVDHREMGSETATDNEFANAASQVSTHYSIAKDGTVRQHVAEGTAAWGNGTDPSRGAAYYGADLSIPWIADAFAQGVNANLVTISIEHEGTWNEPLTEAQYQATLALHRDIFKRQGWPVETGRIVGHFQVNKRDKALCPGPYFPFARLYADLRAAAVPPLNVGELALFPTWAQARLANGQDFRGQGGLLDFTTHLKGIGADASAPTRYGWPG